MDEAIQQGDLTQQDTDACSARVYVRRLLLSTRALCYVWTSSPDVGSLLTSPFTDRVKILVMQDQSAPLQDWLSQERNVFLDFH